MLKPSKEMLVDMIQESLGPNFILVSSVSLQATHLVVFAHIRLSELITQVESSSVATGFGDLVGNKGATKV